MPSPARFLALAALFVSARAALVPPGHQGSPNQPVDVSEADAPTTDSNAIVQTLGQVDQKSSPPHDAPPSADVPPTTVTAIDGSLTNATVSTVAGSSSDTTPSTRKRRNLGRLGKRTSGFKKVFDGLPAGQHDASIQGTAYLTYTVVPNSTYNVQACLDWCTQRVDGCVFVNLFYEYNNYLLDFVFSEKSNLKCAAYGDVHNATEKLNFGGQSSYPQVGSEPVPLTYITQSSGYAADSLVDPDTPDGYDLVFGPTGGANNAPGYMGFAFLDKYDVNACAQLCNGRGVDPLGGGCSYFNIWRAVVKGVPTTYSCAMYYLVADESTAVNYGQGDLVVTMSRGYARKNLVIDGGFEGYTACDDFCFTESYSNWIGTSSKGGSLDASIFHFQPYAHFGSGVALLGAAFGDDSLSGTLTPAKPLATDKGANYVVQVFFISSFSSQALEGPAKVDILWNGKRVGGTSGFVGSYTFSQSDTVVGTGKDVLSFVGGAAPAWTFVDDVKVFKV
ncbi:hypothetical protein MIND_00084700 [Mycena indigotica]|uniref:Fruit-body specific protein a n=1 Tax=Mycena indigotica TaxID=2126181 RepID=A0A8H6WGC3_9AGAR|nr:uncharacterized protein MIND_00084700 [Mycena indigotica]KAF7315691.1 hypothetical protein MIND_00084700 [Mycena indigotica]